MVREATDRNTLEQQELMEDLKGVGSKVNVVAFIALGLLAISVIVNIVLYFTSSASCPDRPQPHPPGPTPAPRLSPSPAGAASAPFL